MVVQSRGEEVKDSNAKINKWFNLNTQDTARDDLKPWRNALPSGILPLVVETYLDLRALTPKHALVLKDDQGSSWNINTKKTEIVMERWLVEVDTDLLEEEDEELPLLYKKLIVTFRYLYVVSRLLPSYKLMKRLNKVKLTTSPLKISTRVLEGNRPIVSKGRVGLSKAIVNNENHLVQKLFKPVLTSVGALKISVSYRRHIDFHLNDTEETLSNHFLHIDKSKNTPSTLRKAFKGGQASPPPTGTSPLTRHDSGASIAQALKFQRSGSLGAHNNSIPKSITSSVGSVGIPFHTNPSQQLQQQIQQQEPVSSSGSTPKYSSSFGKIARRSSIRRSSSVDKGSDEKAMVSAQKLSPSDDDISDFVKMLDNKSDLQLHYSPNVHDSLGRFQMLKSRNELLSESLSQSIYSKSHSPPPAAPSQGTPGQGPAPQAITQPQPQTVIGTPSSSLWPHRLSSASPRSAYNFSVPMMPSRLSETTSSNESLMNDPKSMPISRAGSLSPGSIFKRSSNRSIIIGPSNPTIASTQTHAKMHRTHANSIDSVTANATSADRRDHQTGAEDEDDELLFTMSDMNLTK